MNSRIASFFLLLILASANLTFFASYVAASTTPHSNDPLQFRLEGLTRSPTIGLTSGSLGGWNENEWVPFQLTADNPGNEAVTFEAGMNLEYQNNGRIGIDAFADCFSSSATDCGAGSIPAFGGSATGTGHLWNLTVGSSEQSPVVNFSQEPGGVQTIKWDLQSVAVPAHSTLAIKWAVHLAKGNSTNLACAQGSPLSPCSPVNIPAGLGEGSWPGRSLQVRAASPSIPGERTVSIDVTQQTQPQCVIATAAYGSELAAPVQFLRQFRDQEVASTYLGEQFLTAFNAWYYSWAPNVAKAEATNSYMQAFVRLTIMPLLGILFLAKGLFDFLTPANPELAILASGLIASGLLGIAYLTPLLAFIARARKMRFTKRTLRYATILSVILSLCATIPYHVSQTIEILIAFAIIESILVAPIALTMKLQD